MLKHGPVDVIVLAAGEPRFNGTVFSELKHQATSGTIRVLDAMVLLKEVSGEQKRLDLRELPPEQAAAIGYIDFKKKSFFDTEDALKLYEGMVPGSALIVLAIEHTWAIDLVNALKESGVEMAFSFRVPAPVVDDAFASLESK